MTYHSVADPAATSAGAIYFVGSGAIFSRVALRTVENELDCSAHRVPDMDALRFAHMNDAGSVKPAFMVIVHESCARALLAALEKGAEYLPKYRLAIAFEAETTACEMFADICDDLLRLRVSLLPMNTNVTNWIRLMQVIQSGGHFVPPELLPARPDRASAGEAAQTATPEQPAAQPAPQPRRSAAAGPQGRPTATAAAPATVTGPTPMVVRDRARAHDRLTPREAEVLEMAAAGRPNKTIAGELELSEHTVKLYMHRIIGKLGVKNRTEAAIWYHQHGQGA